MVRGQGPRGRHRGKGVGEVQHSVMSVPAQGQLALTLHDAQHSSFGMGSRGVHAGLVTNLTST